MAAEGVNMDPEDEYADTSIFENKAGLSDDMRFLASMPELCDVTFLVGETREPVCAVKAVLGARSRFAATAWPGRGEPHKHSFREILAGCFKRCCTPAPPASRRRRRRTGRRRRRRRGIPR